MTGKTNNALSELLDGNEGCNSPLDSKNGAENGSLDEAKRMVYEEHLGRLKAEAEAEESSRKLAVAQTHLTEYAVQKSEDVTQLEKEMESMELLFGQLASSSDETLVDKLRSQINILKAKVTEISGEAKAFAMQQKSDLQNSKGIVSQVRASFYLHQKGFQVAALPVNGSKAAEENESLEESRSSSDMEVESVNLFGSLFFEIED